MRQKQNRKGRTSETPERPPPTSEVEYEIIVVDNDSCDGSKEIFEKDKRIVFIESGSNLGFGKANNLGESFAQCKYLFLLNTDTILHNNAIKIFKDIYEKVIILGF